MSQIRMEYDRLFAEARRLRQLAERADNCAGRVNRNAASLGDAWQGLAYDQFVINGGGVAKGLQNLASQLRARAAQLEAIARSYQAKEQNVKNAIGGMGGGGNGGGGF